MSCHQSNLQNSSSLSKFPLLLRLSKRDGWSVDNTLHSVIFSIAFIQGACRAFSISNGSGTGSNTWLKDTFCPKFILAIWVTGTRFNRILRGHRWWFCILCYFCDHTAHKISGKLRGKSQNWVFPLDHPGDWLKRGIDGAFLRNSTGGFCKSVGHRWA